MCAIPVLSAIFTLGKVNLVSASVAASPFPKTGYQTKSGLIYFDLPSERKENVNRTNMESPKYGQFVSFYYSAYFRRNPAAALDFIDSTDPGQPFLQKHGNGRIIQGIEEGLHTMKVGERRRVIIPPQLGFSRFGLGPLPLTPSRRKKLGQLLDLVGANQGDLVYDLELVSIQEDENDQGYYEDVPVSQEEVRQLVLKSLQQPQLQLKIGGTNSPAPVISPTAESAVRNAVK